MCYSVLKQACLTRIDLALGQASVHDLSCRGRSSVRGAGAYGCGSIYASQAGRKVMDREARDLAVASSSGGSKVWT